jgi:hypothetical protein
MALITDTRLLLGTARHSALLRGAYFVSPGWAVTQAAAQTAPSIPRARATPGFDQ